MTDETPNAEPPRKRRKDERPAEIIEAGLKEFAEKGFAATRLEDVAARAGVVKGTIYRYFADKDELFEAAIRSQVAPVFDHVEALVDAFPGSCEELLKAVFRRIYEQMFETDLNVLMRIIISEGGRHPKIAEYYYTQSISKGRALLTKIIARGVERGEFRAGPASDLPMIVLAPAIMAMVWTMTFDRFDPVAAERFMAAHIDLVFNGLRANAAH